MARMLPPEPGEETQSPAERELFSVLRKGLTDEWTVLHSVGIARHERKPWAELDFVLVGPEGIFCLEVKGGRVARRADGKWEFTNRRDKVAVKTEGPWAQVGSGSAALRTYLTTQHADLKPVIVGYGVVMPDITFLMPGPDIDLELLYDERDSDKPFERYLDRLVTQWRGRLHRQKGKAPARMSASLCKAAVDLMRGEFDYRPSIRTRIGRATCELLKLTEEQCRVLSSMEENERLFIKGSAGTGKTLLAIEEARRLAREHQQVLLCCYNRNLSHMLKTAVSDISEIEATTLHSLMWREIREAGLESHLPNADEDALNAFFIPEVCCEALIERDRLGLFDALVMDEAQDLLTEEYLEVLAAVLKGGLKDGAWRVFYDPNQDLFTGMQPAGVSTLQGCSPGKHKLLVNCRNTAQIAGFTTFLTGLDSVERSLVEGPEVQHSWYRDDDGQLGLVRKEVTRLVSEGVPPSEICILSPFKLVNSAIRRAQFDVDVVPYESADAAADAVRFATIGSFKGLEADAIILVDVVDLGSNTARQQLYVGLSRARAYLAVMLNEKTRDDYDERAREWGERFADV